MAKKINLVIGTVLIFMLVYSLVFGAEKKLRYGTGVEYFATDRVYDTNGETIVTDSTVFEFRFPLYFMYNYNELSQLTFKIPYVYRKAEFIDSEFNRAGKGIGDIELYNEMILKKEIGFLPQLIGKVGIILPTGTDNIQSCDLGDSELPTGGPLMGSDAVYWFGRTYNLVLQLNANKHFSKHTYGSLIGYTYTFPTATTGFRVKTGNIFNIGAGYEYAANNDTSLGIWLKSFSSERIKMDSIKLDYTPVIIGRLEPSFSVLLNSGCKMTFTLQIPVFGKNALKGLGYTYAILF